MDDPSAPRWHEALVYAVTGERRPELARQVEPDLDAVVEAVAGRQWTPSPVPVDLMRRIGPAQFAAVLMQLRQRLASSAHQAPVLADRPPDADERRLLADVPPHH